MGKNISSAFEDVCMLELDCGKAGRFSMDRGGPKHWVWISRWFQIYIYSISLPRTQAVDGPTNAAQTEPCIIEVLPKQNA
jgi:hypothetical protein